MEGCIAITNRCNARCQMCNIWRYPTKPGEEIQPKHLENLPRGIRFINLTGGEPFLRDDVEEFLNVLKKKVKRIIISTNGYFTDKIVKLVKKHPDVGIRISIDGLPSIHDELRGIKDGFDLGLRTLFDLHRQGVKDIGFGFTVSDKNVLDMIELYEMAKMMNLEFATAAAHNVYYFHKFDNRITRVEEMGKEFDKLIIDMLKSKRVKNWFRAYFNYGLKNYVNGGRRLLPCKAGSNFFYLDPVGELRPCNGMEVSLGNIKEKSFQDLWMCERAEQIRKDVRECEMNCWMIGSVTPMMAEKVWIPTLWVIKQKLRLILGKKLFLDTPSLK